jgi:hypothetical protein
MEMRFKYTNRLGLNTGDMNMTRMITGQHGEQYKEERVVIDGHYEYYASITLPEITTERGDKVPHHNRHFRIRIHDNLDGRVVAKFNSLKEQFKGAEIKLIQVAKAELIVEFTEEDMQATYCPCTTHRHNINHRKEIGECKAFRPQDVANGRWRSELTDLSLVGEGIGEGICKSKEDYNERVAKALAIHDAQYANVEEAIASVEQDNDAQQLERTVQRELEHIAEGKDWEDGAFRRCRTHGKVVKESPSKNITMYDRGERKNSPLRTMSSLLTSEQKWSFPHIINETFFDHHKHQMAVKLAERWMIVDEDGDSAFFFHKKSEANKFFKELSVGEDAWMGHYIIEGLKPNYKFFVTDEQKEQPYAIIARHNTLEDCLDHVFNDLGCMSQEEFYNGGIDSEHHTRDASSHEYSDLHRSSSRFVVASEVEYREGNWGQEPTKPFNQHQTYSIRVLDVGHPIFRNILSGFPTDDEISDFVKSTTSPSVYLNSQQKMAGNYDRHTLIRMLKAEAHVKRCLGETDYNEGMSITAFNSKEATQ